MSDDERSGIDRRTLIKRAAAAGAVAWTAPVIIGSVASPAGAITCNGACFSIQFAPQNGNCNSNSVAQSATCPVSHSSCTNTTALGAGIANTAVCITAANNTCRNDSDPAGPFALGQTACFTAGTCAAPRQFLAAQAITTAGACVPGTGVPGTSVSFAKPAGATWAGFKFLIGCGCS